MKHRVPEAVVEGADGADQEHFEDRERDEDGVPDHGHAPVPLPLLHPHHPRPIHSPPAALTPLHPAGGRRKGSCRKGDTGLNISTFNFFCFQRKDVTFTSLL